MATRGMGPRPHERPYAMSSRVTAARVLDAVAWGEVVIPTEPGAWHALLRHRFADLTLVEYDDDADFENLWWRPDPPRVLNTSEVRIGVSLRRSLRRHAWTSTVDTAFATVVDDCAEDRRPAWLSAHYREVLLELHASGWAHSIEIWDDGDLVAGGFGFGMGNCLTLDSAFTRVPDGARAAIGDLAWRARLAGIGLLNLHWPTALGERMGDRDGTRDELLAALVPHRSPVDVMTDPLPVVRILDSRPRLT